MEMSFALLLTIILIVAAILLFIVFYFLRKNRGDLQKLKADLQQQAKTDDDKTS